ncbi:unnamed protein product [Chondrus crispus]|uniref:Nicotinate-nucleotide pyrophosphorylase [carboxylating] n=1 Tax=Chondrus crispus TaxID=2769 RepID=R7QS58_CHOCR|nr:unnamed protein product [Chondrus crispus]CDF40351.1 unnamed protein product [Chondrus crispus]|eukprot:XP_005710645.1 unnamed protein product [Chondrus crispus]
MRVVVALQLPKGSLTEEACDEMVRKVHGPVDEVCGILMQASLDAVIPKTVNLRPSLVTNSLCRDHVRERERTGDLPLPPSPPFFPTPHHIIHVELASIHKPKQMSSDDAAGGDLPHYEGLLPPSKLRALASSWLLEDAPSFDGGGFVVGDVTTTADIFLKSGAVLAGRAFVDAVFRELDCTVTWASWAVDGAELDAGAGSERRLLLGSVRGAARKVLLGERVALNALAECCAVATAARAAARQKRAAGWGGRVAGTRKTTPGFRLVQKFGMAAGGMDTHRMDLSGMVMLKDNHVRVAGGVGGAVRKARAVVGFSVKIDVECARVEEAFEAAAAGADVVMLDNFGAERFCEAARAVKEKFPAVLVEGSGGITMETLKGYMVEEADVVSFSINRYVKAVDVSMKVRAVGAEK